MGRIKIALISSAVALSVVGVGISAFVFGSQSPKVSGDLSFAGDGALEDGSLASDLGLFDSFELSSIDSSSYSEESGFSTISDLSYGSATIPDEQGESLYVRLRFTYSRRAVQDWIDTNLGSEIYPGYLVASLEVSDLSIFSSQFDTDSVSCYLLHSGSDSPSAFGAGVELVDEKVISNQDGHSGITFKNVISYDSDLGTLLKIGTIDEQSVDLVFALPLSDGYSVESIQGLSFSVGLSVRRAKFDD